MSRLENARQAAKEKLTESKFQEIDKYINSLGLPGTKKAKIWEDYLVGKMVMNTWIEPSDLSSEQLSKIDEDIKSRGTEAILDILDRQMMIPDNLKSHLRKKYLKELLEAKEIIHKKKYSMR